MIKNGLFETKTRVLNGFTLLVSKLLARRPEYNRLRGDNGHNAKSGRLSATLISVFGHLCGYSDTTQWRSALPGVTPSAQPAAKVHSVTRTPSEDVTECTFAATSASQLPERYPRSPRPDRPSRTFHSGNGNNLSGYSNPEVDSIIDRLAATTDPKEVAQLLTDGARILWADMPTLPLYRQQRTLINSSDTYGVTSNPTRWGSGWNMDRWVLTK